jgi:AcrR family transcriptional regulator
MPAGGRTAARPKSRKTASQEEVAPRKAVALKATTQKASPAPKRERATQQRALETRRKIIDAAVQEFGALGFEGASTRTIANQAGVQHTLVTYHFQTKEGLWREAMSSIFADYKHTFDARLQGLRGVDDATKLRLIHEDFIRYGARHLNFHRMMAQVAAKPSPQLDWLVETYLRETFDARAKMIRSAQKAGLFIPGDPYHLEYLFIGAVTRIFMLAAEVEKISGRSPLNPEFIEEHVQVCLGLFFREPPPPRRRRPKEGAPE